MRPSRIGAIKHSMTSTVVMYTSQRLIAEQAVEVSLSIGYAWAMTMTAFWRVMRQSP